MTIRHIAEADFDVLATLITSEAAPCQPRTSPEMIRATLTRQSDVDQTFYDDLVSSETLVHESGGGIDGAIAFGRTRTGLTDILWLAGENEPNVLAAVLSRVLGDGVGPFRAYWYATTISAVLEGLPVRTRPNTHAALLEAGFEGEDGWSYQVLDLEPWVTPDLEQPNESAALSAKVTVDGREVGAYEVGACPQDTSIGELWWMEVYPEYQGKGYGNRVLTSALMALKDLGVSRIHLVVDDDDHVERDRRPAKPLYSEAGFIEVDRLWSYRMGELPPER